MKKLFLWIATFAASLLLLAGCGQSTPSSAGAEHRKMLERAKQRKTNNTAHLEVQNAVRDFQTRYGRLPTNLFEIVKFGIIDKLPIPPDGTDYSYNPSLGNVSLQKIREDKKVR